MRQRLAPPRASLTRRVRWRPSSRSTSAPWIGRSPNARAATANSIEPETELWSVSASASYPSASAVGTSSSGSEAPSRNENAEWQWSSAYIENMFASGGSGYKPFEDAFILAAMSSGVVMWDFDGTLATRPGLWSTCLLEVLDEHAPGHAASRD